MIAPAGLYPFAVVLFPTTALTEKDSPGITMWPPTESAINWMLITRFSQHE